MILRQTPEDDRRPMTPGVPPRHADRPPPAGIEEVSLGGDRLELLVMPVVDTAEAETEAWAWVEATAATEPPVNVPLYGTQVVWSCRRAAILAPESKLASMREALLDFARCDAAVRRLEHEVVALLAVVEEDAPCAVEFDERHRERQPVLAERFSRAVAIRAELARLAPQVLAPPQHPPTLAGQLGERLRERTRLSARVEILQEQVDVLDRVYELCAQRIGDFAVARRHLTLEWVIIVLLAAELVVLLVEVLASAATTPTP